MSIREKIADIVRDPIHGQYACDISCATADDIIAALPECVPDLVWDGFNSGSYEIVVTAGGVGHLYYFGNRDEENEPEYLQGGFLTLISIDQFKVIANTHNRNTIMKAMGVEV